MGRVTIHNYMFPIQFTYKGWEVEISDESGFFSMKDLKVEAKIKIPAEKYAATLYAHYQQTQEILNFRRNSNRESSTPVRRCVPLAYYQQPKVEENKEVYNNYFKLAKVYATKRSVIQKTFGVNGGLIDRFLGQNISATEKAQQLVIDYIDNNLGDAWNDFIKSIDNI